MISYSEALKLTLDNVHPLDTEDLDCEKAAQRVLAEDLFSKLDSPTVDVSLKDGYAVHSADVAGASPENQIQLELIGSVSAGNNWDGEILPGQAVRILSGAPLPPGADAILAEEFTQIEGDIITAINDAEPGRNILPRGTDVKNGDLLAASGTILFPQLIGFLAAAGHHQIPVIRQPRVAIVATGDEVIAPGEPIVKGKLFASNLITLAAWCHQFGFNVETWVVRDKQDDLQRVMTDCLRDYDILITSGGAWSGEKDLVVSTLEGIGWQEIYHRVRMGPGKAVGFGQYKTKPIFCLPGGPPSNHMAFLQLALPGLHKLAGFPQPGLPSLSVRLAETVRGQIDWTQFISGTLKKPGDQVLFFPLVQKSRLQMIARTEAILSIPEGQDSIIEGSIVQAQCLIPS